MHDPQRQDPPEGSIRETFGDQSAEFFEKIVSIAPSILYVFDLIEMRNIWVNRSMFLGLGYTAEEVAEFGSNLLQELMHPEDMKKYPAHFASLRHLAPDKVARFEYRMRGKDGSWHWLLSDEMAFSFADDGTVTQIVGSAHDVTDARVREEKINLLVREMNHRIKNLFSVILSMISLTAKTKGEASIEEAFETVQGRVNALAVSQSLSLPTTDDVPTSAHDLISKILRPYTGTQDIRIEGRDSNLTTDQATSLAMVLHEMATNAIKYGSLSSAGGRLTIDLDRSVGQDEKTDLCLVWTEEAAFELTNLSPSLTNGFGSRLIKRSVSQIRGEIELDWRATGLEAKITIPLSKG